MEVDGEFGICVGRLMITEAEGENDCEHEEDSLKDAENDSVGDIEGDEDNEEDGEELKVTELEVVGDILGRAIQGTHNPFPFISQ